MYSVLRKRHMFDVDDCPGCGLHAESILHALWGCESLMSIRVSCNFMTGFHFSHAMTFLDFIVVADTLDKLGCLISDYNVWTKDIPSHIVLLVLDDSHPSV
ncbi:hypothetical protein JRO89_XS01G0226700 [Xanthoceras sorbifolium]|uniref:Reverse transcriptase zinc-binding domain-containing protein n=1 Tax=Xanthoceras sorbifolium TaxID=99658 RepID=A0ABQ8IKN9_9ROSI|nr:hypothetical protein JRO89_XS01G0226700 [Xanthoceras sorbifolium]